MQTLIRQAYIILKQRFNSTKFLGLQYYNVIVISFSSFHLVLFLTIFIELLELFCRATLRIMRYVEYLGNDAR